MPRNPDAPSRCRAPCAKAAIDTHREPDLGHPPWNPDGTDPDWNGPQDQARGYVRGALYAYAWYQLELRRFMVRHGGLWIFSDAETEQEIADSIYKISWTRRSTPRTNPGCGGSWHSPSSRRS
jgi:hypothetical protein